MIKKLLVLSLSVALIFAGTPGADATCNSTSDSTTCGSAGASTWTTSTTGGKFKITDCTAVGGSLSNIFDTFCTSCPQSGNTYANAAQTGCSSTPSAGSNVACQSQGSCPTSSCGALPSAAFTWTKASDTTNCVITSCLAAPMPNSGLTDNFCTSCSKNKFANSYGTACVNPTGGNCSRNSNWTDSDCQVCNAGGKNSANVKASSDHTQCVAASSSSSSVIAVSALLVASLLI